MFRDYFPAMILGYLIGCLNLAHGIALTHGKEIHEVGNGNPGASNITLNFGLKYGILTGGFDILKAIFAAMLAKTLFPEVPDADIFAAASAVIGHMFPIHRKFKGGKGFASYIGMMFCISWQPALIILSVAIANALILDYIVCATVTCILAVPVYLELGLGNTTLSSLTLAVSALITIKHLPNFENIRFNQEPKLRENILKKVKRDKS